MPGGTSPVRWDVGDLHRDKLRKVPGGPGLCSSVSPFGLAHPLDARPAATGRLASASMNDLDMDFLARRRRRLAVAARTPRTSGHDPADGGSPEAPAPKPGRLPRAAAGVHRPGGHLGGGGYFGYMWISDAVPDDYTDRAPARSGSRSRTARAPPTSRRTCRTQGVVASARAFTNAIATRTRARRCSRASTTCASRCPPPRPSSCSTRTNGCRQKVTFKEGLRLSDTLGSSPRRPASRSRSSADGQERRGTGPAVLRQGQAGGLRLPRHLRVQPKMTPTDILAAMVERFNQTAERTTWQGKAKALGHTPHEIMTIASIVQAEAGSTRTWPRSRGSSTTGSTASRR